MKKKRSIILSLGSVILFVLTGCTKTDTVSEDDILTAEPTAIITSEPTATLTSEPTATSTSEPTVVDLSAKKLLKEIETSSLTFYSLYNYPSHYYDFLSLKVDAFTKFLNRKDYATVTLSSYVNANFYKNNGQQDKSDEEWESYSYKAINRDDAIACDEILLANENTFDTLSDKEKISVLNEVKEKQGLRASGKYFASYNSPFLFYVQEQNTAGKSKWYDYIMDSGEEYSELKEILSEEMLNWGDFNY